jgi:GNAT superfamily N-acetyltransferase
MDEIELTGYVPGAIGRVTELQAAYYYTHWQLGLYFEAKAASELSAFLSRFNPARDGAWFARVKDEIVGAVFIDGIDADGEGARLRWFIVAPGYQGCGLGNRLMHAAVCFCQKANYKRVYLTTFSGLNAARHLYEKFGFRLYYEGEGSHLTGSASLVEQKFALVLSGDADRPL